mgnify:CR=1 FL=1
MVVYGHPWKLAEEWLKSSVPGSGWRRKGTPEVGEGSFRTQKRAKEIVIMSELGKVLGSDIEGIDDWEKIEKNLSS